MPAENLVWLPLEASTILDPFILCMGGRLVLVIK
jgi:hypothetical protein